MSPKKDQPDQPPPPTSARDVSEVADDTNTPDPHSAVMVGDVSNDQPAEATVPGDEPLPSSSQGPPAAGKEAVVTEDRTKHQQKNQPSSSRRRKTREEKDGEKGDKRRPETVFDAPAVPRPCAVCGRQFLNYKALFGHMRSHPGREWRGAFPPPVSPHPPLAETLLKITQDLLSRPGALPPVTQDLLSRPGALPPVNASLGTGRRLEIDLNREPPVNSPGNDEAAHGGIDLNRDASGESSGSDDAVN